MSSADGLLATNEHVATGVIKNGKTSVTDTDGNKYTDIEIIAIDKANDLAIIRIYEVENAPFLELSLHISDEEYVKMIGARVYTLGYPLGKFSFSSGEICSGIEQNAYDGHMDFQCIKFSNYSAHGSSGSLLVDIDGKVIGIVSVAYYGYRDCPIHYAGSVNPLRDLLESVG